MALEKQLGWLLVMLLAACCARTSSAWPHLPLLRAGTSIRSSSSELDQSSVCGPQLSIETPACTVVEQRDGYELRLYPDGQIWVETVVADSSYAKALIAGFYRCFYYISGKNSRKEDIEMTGPVLIIPAPEYNGWRIAFFAPSRFKSVEDLPVPLDPALYFRQPKAGIKAVLGPFGGFVDQEDYNAKWLELREKLTKDGLAFDEFTVVYAGYSSPFEFKDRKQEVHVVVYPTSHLLLSGPASH